MRDRDASTEVALRHWAAQELAVAVFEFCAEVVSAFPHAPSDLEVLTIRPSRAPTAAGVVNFVEVAEAGARVLDGKHPWVREVKSLFVPRAGDAADRFAERISTVVDQVESSALAALIRSVVEVPLVLRGLAGASEIAAATSAVVRQVVEVILEVDPDAKALREARLRADG